MARVREFLKKTQFFLNILYVEMHYPDNLNIDYQADKKKDRQILFSHRHELLNQIRCATVEITADPAAPTDLVVSACTFAFAPIAATVSTFILAFFTCKSLFHRILVFQEHDLNTTNYKLSKRNRLENFC